MIPILGRYWLLCKLMNKPLVEIVASAHPDVIPDKGSYLSFLTGGITSREEQMDDLVSKLKRMSERV